MREYLVQAVFKQRGRSGRVTAHFIQEGLSRKEAELAALRRLRNDRNVRCIQNWAVVRRDRADRTAVISHMREEHVRRARGFPRDSIVYLPRESGYRLHGLPKNARLGDLTKGARI